MSRKKKLVAIAVPLSNRSGFTPEEEISLRHLDHYLGNYDRYFVAAESLQVERENYQVKRFPDTSFGSVKAYNKLVLSKNFYEAFREYEFLLIYHLDALVFSDQIETWCRAGYDYIGAPWIKFEGAPYEGMPTFENKVGNGGFSLRRIEAILRVFNSRKIYMDPHEFWVKYYANRSWLVRNFLRLLKYPMRWNILNLGNNAQLEAANYWRNEEAFWANRANYYDPDFKIAPIDVALQFAFEVNPSLCYEKNQFELPFGCHAWQRYDRQFWEPYLLAG